MNSLMDFNKFIGTNSVHIPLGSIFINLIAAATLAYILSQIYIRFGSSLSNRAEMSKNFVLLSVSTVLIITIVKSSIALSLGLVGALSIVRFRTAIKEPEELAYLFLCIALGLGFGASQFLATVFSFFVIVCFIVLTHILFKKHKVEPINMVVRVARGSVKLNDIVDTVTKHASGAHLKRFDEDEHHLEALFVVHYASQHELYQTSDALNSLTDNCEVSAFV